MPPESPSPEPDESVVDANEVERLIAERVEESQRQFGRIYDRAMGNGTDPRQIFLDEANSLGPREIYGDERVATFQESVRALTWTTRDEFIDGMLALAALFHRARFFDPDVRARIESRHEREEQLDAGLLQLKLRRSEDDVTLRDGTHIEPGSIVVELSVAERKSAPGLRELQNSFRTVAAYVEAHPDVVAVTGVSWMMNRGLVERLGFERFAHVPISPGQKEKIADIAQKAREEKNYEREVTPDDVAYGAISRADFLRRFGTKETSTDAEAHDPRI